MLKSLVVLSLLAIASATTPHALSEITGAVTTVTVTATYPDAGTAPVLTAFTYTPLTYDSSATNLASFTITGTATFSSVNNTVTGGSLILTNGGDTVTLGFITTGISGLTATLSGGGSAKFLNTASYAASVVLVTSLFNTYTVTLSSGAFPAVAATKYTPPTISAFNLVSPQSGGCDATSCANNLNGTVTLSTTTPVSWTTMLRSSHAAQGVVFASQASVTTGVSNFNTDTNTRLATAIAGVSGGVFGPTVPGVSSNTHIPSTSNDNFAISGYLVDTSSRNTYFSEATVGAKQASVQINTASTDVTAPTCTVLTVAPTTVTTIDAGVPVTVTLTCADESGGSGLWIAGFFATASVTSGTPYSFPVGHTVVGTYSQSVLPYVSGSLSIVGVWAIDNSGNAALYGSCGSATGYDTLCGGGGGGSSSASTVAFSLFSVLLAVLVLFA